MALRPPTIFAYHIICENELNAEIKRNSIIMLIKET